jgi:hypothetical protein
MFQRQKRFSAKGSCISKAQSILHKVGRIFRLPGGLFGCKVGSFNFSWVLPFFNTGISVFIGLAY